MAAKDMIDLLDIKEDLVPELETCRARQGMFEVVKHPLVFSVPHCDQMNAFLNRQLEQKQIAVERAIEASDFGQAIMMHERPYRLQAFVEYASDMTDNDYWHNLGCIWTDSENIWQYKPVWRACLQSKRPERDAFMSEEDRKALTKLSDRLMVWRGYRLRKNKSGFSYTLDQSRAEWFANRFYGGGGKVIGKEVAKSDVFAYLGGRGEKEIIILGR